MSNELLPCPFCGQRPKSGDSSYGYWSVFCHDGNLCDVAPSSEGATEDEARAAWNTRATDTQVSKLVSAARSMLPRNLCITNRNIPDSTIVPLDVTMGSLRKIAQAIASATGEA